MPSSNIMALVDRRRRLPRIVLQPMLACAKLIFRMMVIGWMSEHG